MKQYFLNTYIDKTLLSRATAAAKILEVSRSKLVRLALEEYLLSFERVQAKEREMEEKE
jgi:antitoxin component of RelBE/YafQ-DinJ toxin-antitoxin module